jgi:hypothetical protein
VQCDVRDALVVGLNPSTVQRISRPFDGASVAVA